jgi:hypothetical protein
MRLAVLGDLFGKRLCGARWLAAFKTMPKTPNYLAGGQCIRCHRPRDTNEAAPYYGYGPTSRCQSYAKAITLGERNGRPNDTEEHARQRGGCAYCGVEEWWWTSSPSTQFEGFGEARRCKACFSYRLEHGVERDSELWYVWICMSI